MVEYFNILDNFPKSIPYAFWGLIFIVVGIKLIISKLNSKPNSSRHSIAYLSIFTGIAIVYTIISSYTIIGEYFKLRNIMLNNEYSVVEGKVTDFLPMPPEGHQKEYFIVNGVEFSYSDYEITAGFNNTKSHGGPIDLGKYVKIYYYENHILRLWVGYD